MLLPPQSRVRPLTGLVTSALEWEQPPPVSGLGHVNSLVDRVVTIVDRPRCFSGHVIRTVHDEIGEHVAGELGLVWRDMIHQLQIAEVIVSLNHSCPN